MEFLSLSAVFLFPIQVDGEEDFLGRSVWKDSLQVETVTRVIIDGRNLPTPDIKVEDIALQTDISKRFQRCSL